MRRQQLFFRVIATHWRVIYDDADHGFFCDQRASFHADSAADAWTRVKGLFEANLR